jgi:hypothetical protein
VVSVASPRVKVKTPVPLSNDKPEMLGAYNPVLSDNALPATADNDNAETGRVSPTSDGANFLPTESYFTNVTLAIFYILKLFKISKLFILKNLG